jgi:hypothetical protein
MDKWPDGTSVTPWADPWHDVAADVRESLEALNSIVRQGIEPRPFPDLSTLPAGTLDLDELGAYMRHCMEHMSLEQDPDCRYCRDEEYTRRQVAKFWGLDD